MRRVLQGERAEERFRGMCCDQGSVDLLTVAVKGVNAMVMCIVRGGDNVVSGFKDSRSGFG